MKKRRGSIAPVTRPNRPPGFLESGPLPLAETVPPARLAPLVNAANSYLRTYTLGECTVIVTRESGEWHLSINHRTRYPTWLEISEAWYRLIPGAGTLTGALILPPIHEYVNLNKHVMHVMQIESGEAAP